MYGLLLTRRLNIKKLWNRTKGKLKQVKGEGVVVVIRLSVVTFSGCCLFEVLGDADEGEADDDDITLESGFIRVSSGHGGFMDRQEDRQEDRQTDRETDRHNKTRRTVWMVECKKQWI